MNTTEDFRRQPPPPLAPRELNLPTPIESRLSNGVRLVIVEDRRLPLVNFRLALPFGTAFDPPDLPGLTDMLTSLLTEGTSGKVPRASREIADEVARLGATLSADASSDYIVVAASSLKNFGDEILQLMADVALRPSFPETEIELVKRNTKEGLALQRSQPSFLATERIAKTIYGEHPYSVVAPTPASVEAFTRDQLIRHQQAMFVPASSVLIAVGDLDAEELRRRAEEMFGADAWSEREKPIAKFTAPPVRERSTVQLVDRPGSQQTNIVIANPAITRTDADYFPTLLMHTVLGANASSRIFMNLREDKGYTYGAYTNLDARRGAGSFRATSEVRVDVTGDALREFFYELNRIRDEEVSDAELADAKSYLTGVFPVRLETQEGLTNQFVQIKMYDLPDDHLRTYREQVVRVTKEDVQRVARRYVTPDKAAIVIVGDLEATREQVAHYADEIEIYDVSGQQREEDGEASLAPVEATGRWSLIITVPGQTVAATLVIDCESENLSGRIDSDFGSTELHNLAVTGSKLDANLALEIQGHQLDGSVSARFSRDTINGTITLTMPGAPPLSFTGMREAKDEG